MRALKAAVFCGVPLCTHPLFKAPMCPTYAKSGLGDTAMLTLQANLARRVDAENHAASSFNVCVAVVNNIIFYWLKNILA